MQVKVRRWGNSLAVRIPRAAAERAGVEEGATVEVEAEGRSIVARPVHAYDLEALLSKVRESNLHEEVSTGDRVGREAW